LKDFSHINIDSFTFKSHGSEADGGDVTPGELYESFGIFPPLNFRLKKPFSVTYLPSI
jgi:hypothetical protein